jgi:hypothetical protein
MNGAYKYYIAQSRRWCQEQRQDPRQDARRLGSALSHLDGTCRSLELFRGSWESINILRRGLTRGCRREHPAWQ